MKPPDDAASLIRLLALMVRMTGLSAREVSAFSWREIRLWLRTQETGDATPVLNSVPGPDLAPTRTLGSSSPTENIAAAGAPQTLSAASPTEHLVDARVVSRAAAGRGRARSTETQAEIHPIGHGDSWGSGAAARPTPHAAPAAEGAEPMSPERHRSQMQTFVAFEPHGEPRQGLPGGLPGPTPGAATTGAENTPSGQASREPLSPSFSSPNALRQNALRQDASRQDASGEAGAPIGQSPPQGPPDRRVIQLDIRLDEGLKLERPFSDTAFDHELDVTVAPLGHFGGQ